MKQNQGVLLLLVAVLALGLYAYFGEYKREINEAKNKESQLKILKFPPDQIKKIRGITAGEVLELDKSVEGWSVKSPYQDQADSEMIDQMLNQMSNEKIVDKIKIQSGIDLTEFGLKNPAGHIEFINNKDEIQKIFISSRKNFENLQYLQVSDQDGILTSGDSWFSFLGKPSSTFRDLRLLRFGISKLESFRLKNNSGEFEIINKEAQWIPKNGDWDLDQNEVRSYLMQLTQAKAVEILNSKAKGQFIKKVDLNFEGRKWSAEFFLEKESKNLLVNVSDPILSLKFGPQTLEKLKDLTLFDLRNKSEVFDFDKSQVERIEWTTPLKKQAIVKSSGIWKQQPEDNNFRVDQKAGEQLMDKLRNLKVYRFVKSPPTQINLQNKIKLLDADSKTVFELSWTEFKNFEAWSKSSLSSEVFQMDDAQMSRLGLSDIIQSLPPKESNEKN
ncbi:MAG: DUF4340 domain-containing protein [Bdellovibrionales bacterium]